MTIDDELPFSQPVRVRGLPSRGLYLTYEADDEVAERIARENDLISVADFIATARVKPWQRDGVRVSGKVSAKLVQPCAVTGEPLETSLDEPFEITFVPEDSRLAKPRRSEDSEWILDPEGDDVPDTFNGDTIDLAGLWLETFVLGLDPFARIDGAELPEAATNTVQDSPFAALEQLKLH